MSKVHEIVETIKAKVAEANQIKKDLTELLRPDFKNLFVPFLEKYPGIEQIKWTQYTPYFNDGDPCEFRVSDIEAFTNTNTEIEEDESEGILPVYGSCFERSSRYEIEIMDLALAVFGSDEATKIANEDFKQLVKTVEEIPEDIMLELFGDHAEVSVTKDGISIEEYDHD